MNKRKTRQAYLIINIVFLFGAIFSYSPGIVFYFDQIKGEAQIISITGNYCNFEYFHSGKKENIVLSFREGNSKKLRQLSKGMKVPILYSNTYPDQVSILNYDSIPSLHGVIVILIFVLAVYALTFKNIE